MRSFKRPIILDIKIRAELSMPRPYYKKGTKILVDVKIAPTLIPLEKKGADGKPILTLDPKMIWDDKFKKFDRLTYSLGKLNRLAELNLDNLLSFISHYCHTNNYKELCNRSKDCKSCEKYNIEKGFHNLSFGQLRNILSCIVKTDNKFYEIDELKSKPERKHFTTTYNDYIYDRDCYTHGKLFFLYPDFEPVLRVKPPNMEEHYIKLSEEILWENLAMWDYLEKVLKKMHNLIQLSA